MKKQLSIILVLIWMIIIFIMSSFNAEDSANQSNFIVNIISNVLNINNIELLNLIIRKLAHYIEYLILGILVINMFIKNNIPKSYLISIIFCVIYAISDEIHQFIIPGRACQIKDILIDSIGSITGIYLYKLISKRKKSIN